MKEGFKMIFLVGDHRCSAVRQLKVKSGHKWSEHLVPVTQVIRWDSHAVLQAEAIKSPRMNNKPTAIVYTDLSFLLVRKVVLNYSGAFSCSMASHFLRPVLKISSKI